MVADPHTLAALRARLAAVSGPPPAGGRVRLGAESLDAALGGGMARAALHEAYAARPGDHGAVLGFAAGLARRAAAGRLTLWVRPETLEAEAGRLYAPGLAALGLDPDRVALIRPRDAAGALRAAGEAARCRGLGAALIEIAGAPRALDLTATRRLALAAQSAGVFTLLIRIAAEPAPSAAETRWRVEGAASHALAGNAPGDPAFSLALLRHRAGPAGRVWRLEWRRDQDRFLERAGPEAPPVPRPVAALPGDRPARPGAGARRRAG